MSPISLHFSPPHSGQIEAPKSQYHDHDSRYISYCRLRQYVSGEDHNYAKKKFVFGLPNDEWSILSLKKNCKKGANALEEIHVVVMIL